MKRKRPQAIFPWQDTAVALVALLQGAIAIGVLFFAYSVYQSTPVADGPGGLSALSFFAQFWLGAMFLAAVVAFSTGIFTWVKHRGYVACSGILQIVLGCLFLVLGGWTFPITAALVVFAFCSILIVREATTNERTAAKPAPLRRLSANVGSQVASRA